MFGDCRGSREEGIEMGSRENVEGWEERVDKTDFFVGYQAQGGNHQGNCYCELEAGG